MTYYMTLFSEIWNLTILSFGEKRVLSIWGSYNKNAQQIQTDKKQFLGLLYSVILNLKKNPKTACGPRVTPQN